MILEPAAIDRALAELRSRDLASIHAETARQWAARAAVAFGECQQTGDLAWLLIAHDCMGEALEHAGASAGLIDPRALEGELEPFRALAIEAALHGRGT